MKTVRVESRTTRVFRVRMQDEWTLTKWTCEARGPRPRDICSAGAGVRSAAGLGSGMPPSGAFVPPCVISAETSCWQAPASLFAVLHSRQCPEERAAHFEKSRAQLFKSASNESEIDGRYGQRFVAGFVPDMNRHSIYHTFRRDRIYCNLRHSNGEKTRDMSLNLV